VDVVCSELLDPLRVALLEWQLRASFRSRQKASLTGRTQPGAQLSELHEEKLAKLDGLRHGIDPAAINEAIDRLSERASRRTGISRSLGPAHPDVPLRLAAPDDLSAPEGPEERVRDRQCPGSGTYRIHTG
jgi:hypothetical protein